MQQCSLAWSKRTYLITETAIYFDRGKFGGVFALSSAAAAEVFPLPEITADDEYVRRSFSVNETAFVDTCRFKVRAPRTLASLVRVRRRSIRGAREVTSLGFSNPERQSIGVLILRVMRSPRNLIPVAIYAAINTFVRLQLAFEGNASTLRWERDLSTRTAG